MKTLFVIADTHRRLVIPPEGYITVHCGDFVDAFEDRKSLAHWHHCYGVATSYSYVVAGNHEAILLQKYRHLPEFIKWHSLPTVRYFQVEDVRVRVCHTLPLPRSGQSEFPPIPRSLIQNMFPVIQSEGCQLYLCGHDHSQYHFEHAGMHIVNPGDGEKGEYAVVTVDGNRCDVSLCTESTSAR